MRNIKRLGSIFLCLLLAFNIFNIFCCNAYAENAEALQAYDVLVNVKYQQAKARNIFNLVNEFRTSNNAWAWNENNTAKIYYNDLQNLTYDYQLEKVAMQRAAEIALSYGHTRPDNSEFSSAYYDCEYTFTESSTQLCENIAAGQLSYQDAFTSWLEENLDYQYQGHRRCMLNSSVTRIGIACVYYNNTYYWVQEFSNSNATNAYTEPNNNYTLAQVRVKPQSVSLSIANNKLAISAGEQVNIPDITANIICSDNFTAKRGYAKTKCEVIPLQKLVSIDKGIAKVESSKITGIKKGNTILRISALGKSISCKLTVKSKKPNPMKLAVNSKSIKHSAITETGKTFKIKIRNAQGSVTYSSDNPDCITVSNNGKVSIKNGTPKGTYKIKITANGNSKYKSAVKTFKIKII